MHRALAQCNAKRPTVNRPYEVAVHEAMLRIMPLLVCPSIDLRVTQGTQRKAQDMRKL